MEVLRLMIVEDNRTLLGTLATALDREPGLWVTGAYATAEEAVSGGAWGETEALLVDLELPGMSGLELIEWVRANHPSVLCAVHTIHDDRDLVFRAIEAGALGYVLKGEDAAGIGHQLRGLREGRAPLSPAIAMMLLRALGPEKISAETEPLSARETELLRLVAAGNRYVEVAQSLGISPHTVQSHISRIYAKLQATGRRDAIRRARMLGLI